MAGGGGYRANLRGDNLGDRRDEEMKEGYLKYGGVRFRAKASPEEINTFVRNLPEGQRGSMQEVARALRDAGLIETDDEFSTWDDEIRPFLEGKPGPDEGGEMPKWDTTG